MFSNHGFGEDSCDSLGLQEDHPVNLQGNQLWIFTGRTDAEAEAPILWLPAVKSWLTGEDPDAGKDWKQKHRVRWLDDIADLMDMSLSKLQEKVKDREAWSAEVYGVAKRCTQLTAKQQHIYPLPLEPPSHPILSSRSSRGTELSSEWCRASSH